MTIVFKISDNLKNMVIKYYEKYIPLKTPPYAVFQVKNYDTVNDKLLNESEVLTFYL